MCGINGIIDFRDGIDRELLHNMNKIISYRGPDDSGIFIDKNCGLGHQRLSIIDLSKKAHQPMTLGVHTIVFNGEIYNYKELRRELGGNWISDSDTEVILRAYQKWGDACVSRLRGMFAFAVWDGKSLFLARDRVGQKPLWYYQNTKLFVFSSELKALLLHPEIKREVDPGAISSYLTYGYIPNPKSIFKQVYKVKPGHTLTISKDGVKEQSYWNIQYTKGTNSNTHKEFKKLFEESVRIRMLADVPVGSFLSGGIDSSAVVAMMSKHSEQPIKTFTIGFDENSYDERPYAKQIAEQFECDHHEKTVSMDCIKLLPELVWLYNEPYADSSALPSYHVSKFARQNVKVTLNGDGGDESFAGYERVVAHKILQKYHAMPRTLRYPFEKVVNALPQPSGNKHPLRKIQRVMQTSGDDVQQYLALINQCTHKQRDELGVEGSTTILKEHFSQYINPLHKALYFDFKHYLPDDLLVKMDLASMRHGLETRSPFLDHKLIEFASKIPPSSHTSGLQTKTFLKQSFGDILPKNILQRGKFGFSVPIDHWFRGELGEIAAQTFTSKEFLARQGINTKAVQGMLQKHRSGRENNKSALWALLTLELWYRTYQDTDGKHPLKGTI